MKRSYSFITAALLLLSTGMVSAQTAPDLGVAHSFALLAGVGIQSIGTSSISGDVGISPGITLLGLTTSNITNGKTYVNNSTAAAAQTAALTAYDYILNQTAPPANNLTGKTLGTSSGATTLLPGVYSFSGSASLSGTLTLDDTSNPNAVFIIKIAGSLTTNISSKVVMKSGGIGANVFWQVGGVVTTNISTIFCGNILSAGNVVMNLGTTTTGRVFSLQGAIVMSNTSAVASVLQVIDTDGDGVADILDDYPNDPTKAFDNPSSTGSGSTVAFEDQWPKKGDFDLNDLVVLYKYNVVTNAQNVVVHVTEILAC